MMFSKSKSLNVKLLPVRSTISAYCVDLSLYKEELDLARLGVFDLLKTHPCKEALNIKSNESTPLNSHLLSTKLEPICDLICEIAMNIAVNYLAQNFDKQNLIFKVHSCWSASYKENDYAVSHNHFPADLAAVIYLDVEQNSAPLILGEGIMMIPRANSLIIFPGILQHHVPQASGVRRVLAMNLNTERYERS